MCLSCSGSSKERAVKIPDVDIDENGKQTRPFINMKVALVRHLKSLCHTKAVEECLEHEIRLNREADKDWLAGKNLGWLIYTSIMRGDSYSSYEDRVLMLRKMGVFVGTRNHSEAFPPQFVRACNDILKESIVLYMKFMSKKLGFQLPFSLTCDKDTAKHRSRQVNTHTFIHYAVTS